MTAANIPDIGFAINCDRSEEPVYWSPAAGSCDQPDGPSGPYFIDNATFELAKQSGYLPTRMAFLSYSIAISAQAAQEYEYVYQHMGGTVCYSRLRRVAGVGLARIRRREHAADTAATGRSTPWT